MAAESCDAVGLDWNDADGSPKTLTYRTRLGSLYRSHTFEKEKSPDEVSDPSRRVTEAEVKVMSPGCFPMNSKGRLVSVGSNDERDFKAYLPAPTESQSMANDHHVYQSVTHSATELNPFLLSDDVFHISSPSPSRFVKPEKRSINTTRPQVSSNDSDFEILPDLLGKEQLKLKKKAEAAIVSNTGLLLTSSKDHSYSCLQLDSSPQPRVSDTSGDYSKLQVRRRSTQGSVYQALTIPAQPTTQGKRKTKNMSFSDKLPTRADWQQPASSEHAYPQKLFGKDQVLSYGQSCPVKQSTIPALATSSPGSSSYSSPPYHLQRSPYPHSPMDEGFQKLEDLPYSSPAYVQLLEEDNITTEQYWLLSVLSFLLSPIISLLAIWFTSSLSDARQQKNKMAAAERAHIVRVCLVAALCFGVITYSLLALAIFYVFPKHQQS